MTEKQQSLESTSRQIQKGDVWYNHETGDLVEWLVTPQEGDVVDPKGLLYNGKHPEVGDVIPRWMMTYTDKGWWLLMTCAPEHVDILREGKLVK